MIVAALCSFWLLAPAADQAAAEASPEAAATDGPTARAAPPPSPDAPMVDEANEELWLPPLEDPGVPAEKPPYRPRLSRRTWQELCQDPSRQQDPLCQLDGALKGPGAEYARPAVLGRRSKLAAAALGGVVGFGSGFFYAGDHFQGTVLAAVDSALWVGFASVLVALNQLVIRNDFRTYKSLSRGERPFGKWESNYYALSWVAAGFLLGSHIYQLIAAPLAAAATNRTLAGFSVIPLQGGGSAQLQLRF